MGESAEAFLDQLITWRELGFNGCALGTDWDRFPFGVGETCGLTYGANGTFLAVGGGGVVVQSAPWGAPP